MLVGGRKVAGILAESSEGRVVLGDRRQREPDARTAAGRRRADRADVAPVESGAADQTARALLAAILLRLERAYDPWVDRARGTAASG